MAFSNPAEGKDKEFDAWSENEHIPDVLGLPGFISAQRLKYCDVKSAGLPLRWKTATIYEVETDDPAELFANMFEASRKGRMPIAECADMSTAFVGLFEPVSPTILPRK
jgi:hypothetical protein